VTKSERYLGNTKVLWEIEGIITCLYIDKPHNKSEKRISNPTIFSHSPNTQTSRYFLVGSKVHTAMAMSSSVNPSSCSLYMVGSQTYFDFTYSLPRFLHPFILYYRMCFGIVSKIIISRFCLSFLFLNLWSSRANATFDIRRDFLSWNSTRISKSRKTENVPNEHWELWRKWKRHDRQNGGAKERNCARSPLGMRDSFCRSRQ
jgi:hypothetical protein